MARVNHQTHIHTTDGSEHVTDVVIWVTGARPPAWFAQTDLTGRDGFFEIGDTLQTTRDPAIFASGDCATHATKSWPKAGVYAVKQGPILAANLRRALSSAPLQPYVPQEAALALISTGDQGAIAVRGGWTLTTPRGPLWRWKDHIDRGWMAKYQQETQ